MSRQQTKSMFNIIIEISWVSNLTIGRNVYVKWKYSPLEHGKTKPSTVGINEKAEFVMKNFSDEEGEVGEGEREGEGTSKARKKKAHKERNKSLIEIKNRKKFHELSLVLGEVDEKGRKHEIGNASFCLSNLVSRTSDRQVLLELDADPKKSSTLLVNKRPVLCLHTKVSRS